MTTRLRICNEKYHKEEEEVLKNIDEKEHEEASKLRAAFFRRKIWDSNQTITIGFFGYNNKNLEYTPLKYLEKYNMDPIEKEIRGMYPEDAVKKVIIERIQPIIGLKLEFVDNVKEAMIRISFEDDGAWSYVGTDALAQPSNQATMNFGWIDASTIMHEFGHCLGMIHEHQNPRGETIPWDVQAVYDWARLTQGWDKSVTDTNILDHYSKDITNGSGFDKDSIMLYFFPGSLTTDGKGTNQNLKLSQIDVVWLNRHYPNSKISPEEFYKKVYNQELTYEVDIENVEKEQNEDDSEESSGNYLLNFLILALFIVICVYIFMLMTKDDNSLKNIEKNIPIENKFTSSNNEIVKFASFISLLK